MRTWLACCAIALTGALPALAAEPSPAQVLFDRLRARVIENMRRVPRYTCVETITRTRYKPQYGGRFASCPGLIAARAQVASPGLLLWHDRLRLDVAIGHDGEIFSWAGARAFETGDISKLTSSGATGSGAFSSFLTSIFGSDAEDFRYTGEQDTSLGHLASYQYVVPLSKSHYSYRMSDEANQTIGYRGWFYVEPASAKLERLVVDASEFPEGDLCRVVDTMDYATVKIGTGDFLLPEVSKMVVLYRNGEEARNETHFSSCHEFTGQSTLLFDDSDEPSSPAAVAKAALKSLPPHTRVRVKIDPPIDSATAAAGDFIVGAVEHEVKDKGQVIIRTTDRLHGRLLRLEQYIAPEPYWLVAIRFDSIERDGVEQPVNFHAVDDGDRRPLPPRYMGRRMQTTRPVPTPQSFGAGVFLLAATGNIVLDRNFHSEWETR
jgi:hypothetical protein